MNIAITPKKTEGLERLLEVSVPVEEVRNAEDRAARRYASRVRLPGFRPGKAPAAMVRKRFADAIRQETIETLVQEAFKEVIEREKLELATQPHVHDVKFGDGEPLTFELHLEIRPTIELPRTTGFRVTRTPRVVTDEQVREQIDNLREGRATWTPVDERPAPGDMVTVELATAEEDGTIGQGREYRLVLGSGQAIPGIEEVIMETAPGATTERSVKWPDDFPDEAQRGKSKAVRVTVKDVKRKSLPALDDAFAREVGDFDSLDALTKTVREDLVRHAEREADAEVRQKLVDEIIAANPFDVPPSWVSQLVQAYLEAYQIPEAEHERFRNEFRPMAERQVRRDLVVDTIAKRESLEATEADIDERVAEVAQKRGAEPGQVYASLQKAGRIKELERSITEDKVFKWLMDKNTVE
ncbi:MAG: trigger factor [Gemmatimonadaceae bacterium]|nr:trigger factor [Gemmatimonadaceae bacterium]